MTDGCVHVGLSAYAEALFACRRVSSPRLSDLSHGRQGRARSATRRGTQLLGRRARQA